MTWLLGSALVASVLIALVLLISPAKVWLRLAGDPDTGPLKLTNLQRSTKPNDGLIAPANTVSLPVDLDPPVFNMQPEELFARVLKTLEADTSINWRERNHEALYARAITYSPGLKFPDVNHIWVLPFGENQSTIALYAVAQLGRSDLGKNLARLQNWLARLEDLPKAKTP